MPEPLRSFNPRQKSVVRKVIREQLADFDEQVWPVTIATLIFAGFVTGIVAAATENFFDPRPFYNGFVRLGIIAVLVAIVLVSTYLLKAPTARRVQFCVIISLFLHMVLAVFMRENYLRLVAFLREQAVPGASVTEEIEEPIAVPDYVEGTLDQSGGVFEYEKPAETPSPAAKDLPAEIDQVALQPPSAESVVASQQEAAIPPAVEPAIPNRPELSSGDRLRERQDRTLRENAAIRRELREQAEVQSPAPLQEVHRDLAPRDQLARNDSPSQEDVILRAPSSQPALPVGPMPPPRVSRQESPPSLSAEEPRPERSRPSPAMVAESEVTLSSPTVPQSASPRQLAGPRIPADYHSASPSVSLGPPLADDSSLLLAPQPISATPSRRRSSEIEMAPKEVGTPMASGRRTSGSGLPLSTSPIAAMESVAGDSPGQSPAQTNLQPRGGVLTSAAPTADLPTHLGNQEETSGDLSAVTAGLAHGYGYAGSSQYRGQRAGTDEGASSRGVLDVTPTTGRGARTGGQSSGLPGSVAADVQPGGEIAEGLAGGEVGTLSGGDRSGEIAYRGPQGQGGELSLLPAGLSGATGVGDVVGDLTGAVGQGGVSPRMASDRAGQEERLIAGGATQLAGRPGRQSGLAQGGLPGSLSAELSQPGDSPGNSLAGGSGNPQSSPLAGAGGMASAGGSDAAGSASGNRREGRLDLAGPSGGPLEIIGASADGSGPTGLRASLGGGVQGDATTRPERLGAGPALTAVARSRSRPQAQLHDAASVVPSEAFTQRSPEKRGVIAEQFGGTAESEAAVEKGLAFLAKIQFSDGHWSLNQLPDPFPGDEKTFGLGSMHGDTAATGLALLAFLGAGYTHQEDKYKDTVLRGLRWLIQNQLSDGRLFRERTDSEMYTQFYGHGLGAIALCEAYGMTKDPALQEPARRAIDFTLRSQSPQYGGWRYVPRKETDTSVTGWHLMALKSAQMAGLDVPETAFQGVAKWLDIAQVEDGARYVYNPFAGDKASQVALRQPNRAMTAEGLLMRIYLGWNRDHPSLQRGAAFLQQNPPDYGTAASPVRDCYYWYYATQVLFQVQGDAWQTWNSQTQALLLKYQDTTGPWTGSWDPFEPVPDRFGKEGGRLYVTTLHLLILEVYYRHLPLFKTLNP